MRQEVVLVLLVAWRWCQADMYCADYTVVQHAEGSQTMLADKGLCRTQMFCVKTSYRTVDGDLQMHHQCAEGAATALTPDAFQACRNGTADGVSAIDVSTIASQAVQCCAHGHCCNVPIDTQFHCEQYLKVLTELDELKARMQLDTNVVESAQQLQAASATNVPGCLCLLLLLAALLCC